MKGFGLGIMVEVRMELCVAMGMVTRVGSREFWQDCNPFLLLPAVSLCKEGRGGGVKDLYASRHYPLFASLQEE
jgi:hypothetical protein